ncbi:MAG: CRISPR-associated helicase Cas3' [Clostridia bacterium]|nr:CRISPR-associated helicase Cas3' [Clostridia bacterium]
MSTFYAHKASDGRVQTVEEHLSGTASLAAEFAESFGAGEYGFLAGMAHDIGKYSEGFQRRLDGGPKVDHSSAGALECAAIGRDEVGMCVAGHHAGLPNYGNMIDGTESDTFIGRLKRFMPQRGRAYPGWTGPLPETASPPDFGDDFTDSFWTRMLFSCLVDADYLDTERFMSDSSVCRGGYDDLGVLRDRLNAYTAKWDGAENGLNGLRNEIRRACVRAGQQEKGIFTLTVPTGGGKTVSSLAFALEHALTHGMKRIIYVIPYTSIIEQNAAVFREILGEGNVVEHHSESEQSYSEDVNPSLQRAALATENWDAPVIVTTAVQFFESLYSDKPSKCRKLHNIVNSVIIFDEAQSIPVGHFLPCFAAIGVLVRRFGVSAVLCSATQPFVSDVLDEYLPGKRRTEICDDVDRVFRALERVRYRKLGKTTKETLAQKLNAEKQALCIVNTRRAAKELYDLLPREGTYHLSTLMMPQHRRKTLSVIRQRLADGLPCRVVSTSLVEAGVDVDFPLVFREIAGLDSIVQAAGRCNREGKRPLDESIVSVFELDGNVPRLLRINVGATREVLSISDDLGSRESVERYFRVFRNLIGESTDQADTVKNLTKGIAGNRLPFRTVAEAFHLIDQNTNVVYVPTEDSKALIEEIRRGEARRSTFRKLGQYGVNVYENHYRELLDAGDIEELTPGCGVLINPTVYDENTGLSLNADSGRAEFV